MIAALRKNISELLVISWNKRVFHDNQSGKGDLTWNDILSKTLVKNLVFKENKIKNTLLVLCAFNFSLLIFEEEKVSCYIWIKMQTLKASYTRTTGLIKEKMNSLYAFSDFSFFFFFFLMDIKETFPIF